MCAGLWRQRERLLSLLSGAICRNRKSHFPESLSLPQMHLLFTSQGQVFQNSTTIYYPSQWRPWFPGRSLKPLPLPKPSWPNHSVKGWWGFQLQKSSSEVNVCRRTSPPPLQPLPVAQGAGISSLLAATILAQGVG